MIRFLITMGLNKKSKKLGSIFAVLVTIATTIAFPLTQASAQSHGLGVTPRESYTMRAGTTASNSLFLANLNKNLPLNVHMNVVDFTAQNETGAAKLLQNTEEPQTPWSLKPYITIPDNVVVPPGGTKQVPFTIKLPASIGAGSYYSAIEYTASTGTNTQQVTIAASTATLLFINVPGQVKEQLTMKSFSMYNDKTNKATSFFNKEPKYFIYRIQNNGNVAEMPVGSVVIKNMFGHIAAKVDTANPKSQLALIGQTRRFTGCNNKSNDPNEIAQDSNCVNFNLKPGLYTATLAVFYGQNGNPTQEIGATTHFWYLPWSFVVEILVALAILVYIIFRIYRRFSRR